VAASVTSGFPVAQLTVTDTNPVWVYCRQANHCQQGMVFAVNPGDKFAAFQAAATGGASATSTTGGVVTATATVTGGVTTTSAATPTSTGSVDHKVVVGGTGVLAYNPSNITAQVGDTVTFEFHQVNHTVTQSSFNTPCRALSLTSTTGAVGFDSGLLVLPYFALFHDIDTCDFQQSRCQWRHYLPYLYDHCERRKRVFS